MISGFSKMGSHKKLSLWAKKAGKWLFGITAPSTSRLPLHQTGCGVPPTLSQPTLSHPFIRPTRALTTFWHTRLPSPTKDAIVFVWRFVAHVEPGFLLEMSIARYRLHLTC